MAVVVQSLEKSRDQKLVQKLPTGSGGVIRNALGWMEGGNCSSQSATAGRDVRTADGGMAAARAVSEGRRWSRSSGRGWAGMRCSWRKPEWSQAGQAVRGSRVPQWRHALVEGASGGSGAAGEGGERGSGGWGASEGARGRTPVRARSRADSWIALMGV